MGAKTNRHTRLALCVLFLVMAGQAYGDWPGWLSDVEIVPPNPTSNDVVLITLSGMWSTSCCPPEVSIVAVSGNDIHFGLIVPDICIALVCDPIPWMQTQYVGPLSPGVYTLYAGLDGSYTEVAQFTVSARIITVDDNGPANFNNIQAAINNANNGDTVLVAAGTYYENISMKNGVTVTGAGADVTTIDGGENGHVVVFNSASGTISGFTITNSGADPISNSGIYISQSTVNINNNIIGDNRYGITLLSNSNYTITGNKVINNSAEGIKVSDSNGTISNNVIAGNSRDGIRCFDSSPSIINNTITGNGGAGVSCDPTSPQVIANNIITHNEIGILACCANDPPSPLLHISYNNVWDNSYANYWEDYGMYDGEYVSQPFTPLPGTGEIHQSPLFADSNSSDYHLKSTAGRWNPNTETWVMDTVTSPCIDAGDPNSDWTKELWPNGKRINMGAYGGTPEASMSLSDIGNIANLDNDVNDIVNLDDLALFVDKWLYQEVLLSEDLDRNGRVDFSDFAIFGDEYYETHLGQPSISYSAGCVEMKSQQGTSQIASAATTATLTEWFIVGGYFIVIDGHYLLASSGITNANCCSSFWLEMTVDGDLITLYGYAIPGYCLCLCDFDINATLGPFPAGTYTLEVYYNDDFRESTTVTIE